MCPETLAPLPCKFKSDASLALQTMQTAVSKVSFPSRAASAASDCLNSGVLDGYYILRAAKRRLPAEVYSVNISDSNLRHVMKQDLSLFEALVSIEAAENELTVESFAEVPFLQKLNLACNRISYIALQCGPNFAYLSSIDLSFNSIKETALITLATFPNLEHLNLSHNNVSLLPPEIVHVEKWLARIYDGANQPTVDSFDADTPGVIGFPRLKSLDLSFNKLANDYALVHTLGKLPQLSTLSLQGNLFETFGSFSYVSQSKLFANLAELNVANNLVALPEALLSVVHLPSLKRLSIAGNPVMATSSNTVAVCDELNASLQWISFDPGFILSQVYQVEVLDIKSPQHSRGYTTSAKSSSNTHGQSVSTSATLEDKLAKTVCKRRLQQSAKRRAADTLLLSITAEKGPTLACDLPLENSQAAKPLDSSSSALSLATVSQAKPMGKSDASATMESTVQQPCSPVFLTGVNLVERRVAEAVEPSFVSPRSLPSLRLSAVTAYYPKSLSHAVRELRFALKYPAKYIRSLQQRVDRKQSATAMRGRLEALRKIRTPVDYLPTASAEKLMRRVTSAAKDRNSSAKATHFNGVPTRLRSPSEISKQVANLIIAGKTLQNQLSRPSSPELEASGRSLLRDLQSNKLVNYERVITINPTMLQLQQRRQKTITNHPHHPTATNSIASRNDLYFSGLVSFMNSIIAKTRLVESSLNKALSEDSYSKCFEQCYRSLKQLDIACRGLEQDVS